MKKNHKPKKSLRTRKHTRAKMKKLESETTESTYWAPFDVRNPEIAQSRQIREAQARIMHDEEVHNRKVRKMMKKERHEAITTRLKEWMKSLVRKER